MVKGITKKKLKLKQISEDQANQKLFFAVRIRGKPGMSQKMRDTLKMLRMNKVNHGVLVWGEKSQLGMLQKVNNFVAFGEINRKALITLLRVRGRIEGGRTLNDLHLKKVSGYNSIKELADELLKGNIKYKDIYKIKPVFRLHPPKGGHRGSIKKHFNEGGTLGYVGDTYINDLIYKMV
ncbi:MAG: 50S ribosomal protein L30 [Promethearchaeota archaeon]|nr:MAG: 50S ribosomal protein L30 [Candidatus Lokiarchaeota archaeon]